MPNVVGSTVMFGKRLAEGLVGRGFRLLRVLVKLMSPTLIFPDSAWYPTKNFTQMGIAKNELAMFYVVVVTQIRRPERYSKPARYWRALVWE
jgi:hypothetical protein